MASENSTTALLKTAQSPALARVSNQLALTEKLLTKPEEPFLIPYRKGNKWGFCDRNKNIVIDCVYDYVEPFNNGIAVVEFDKATCERIMWLRPPSNYYSFGFINNKGAEILSERYSSAKITGKLLIVQKDNILRAFDMEGKNIPLYQDYYNSGICKEGLIAISDQQGWWGFIDELGQEIVETKYYHVNNYCEGVAAVRNEYWGYIDKHGKELIHQEYISASSFSEGLALIEDEDEYGNGHPLFFINKENQQIIDLMNNTYWSIYNQTDLFSEGLALFSKEIEDRPFEFRIKFGYINTTGKEVIPPIYDYASHFSEGLAAVSLNGKNIYINKLGSTIIETDYNHIGGFCEGLAEVIHNNKRGYINRHGQEVIKLKYSYSDYPLHIPFEGGLANIYFTSEEGYRGGYIDKRGVEYWED